MAYRPIQLFYVLVMRDITTYILVYINVYSIHLLYILFCIDFCLGISHSCHVMFLLKKEFDKNFLSLAGFYYYTFWKNVIIFVLSGFRHFRYTTFLVFVWPPELYILWLLIQRFYTFIDQQFFLLWTGVELLVSYCKSYQ